MWKNIYGVSLIWIFLCVSSAFSQTRSFYFDFEDGTLGELPHGWFLPYPGYGAELTDDNPKKGKQCVRLFRKSEEKAARFGNIMQTMDATPYRGKAVRFRAAVRFKGKEPHDRGQLWLRVDRPHQQIGFFDNMADRPIHYSEWAYYDIIGEVAHDAVQINFGLMLLAQGETWLDDVSLETVDDRVAPKPPAPLAGQSLQNMVAFTKLLGYVRHFHPSDEAAECDWNAFTIAGVEAVENAKNAEELAEILRSLFEPLAPTVQVYLTKEARPDPQGVLPRTRLSELGVIAWEHEGFGGSGASGIYKSKRVRAKGKSSWMDRILGDKDRSDLPDPAKPYTAELGGGVSCFVPLAVYFDEKGTLPRPKTTGEKKTQSVRLFTGNDRSTRLAAVALGWNVFQHFYPYFDLIDTNWAAMLKITLKAAAKDEDERAFLDTLSFMVAQLEDGHGHVYHSSNQALATLPLVWDWVENQLVVTHVAAEEHLEDIDLERGDVILSINGIPTTQALKEAEQLVAGATPQFKRYKTLTRLRKGKKDEEVILEVQCNTGTSKRVTLKRVDPSERISEPRPPKVHEVEFGVVYLDVGRIDDRDFQEAFPRLEKARGIIFDFRGYPQDLSAWTFFPYLIEKNAVSQQWHTPCVKSPDRRDLTFKRSGEWLIPPKKPHLKAKRAFITDGRAISYAESCLGIVEHYQLGEIVGGPTAGTNGNVNPFMLPGQYKIYWTGMKVLKHDGAQHHGVGILPTVPVSRTIQGVSEGRDELLERAIEVVLQQ